jgi:transcription initiation factor IIF auxiliary subunit
VTGRRTVLEMAVVLALFCASPATWAQTTGTIAAANTSRYLSSGRWQWTIFLKGSASELANVTCVRYTLHETFPKPVQDVCTYGAADRPFRLDGEGWGVFEVKLTVTFKNGRTRELRHMLQFTSPAEEGPRFTVDNVATPVGEDSWNWEIFLKGQEDALAQIRCVEYTLHRTFPNPVRRVCTRGCGLRGFPLAATGWGTFDVRISVSLKDGRELTLQHALSFAKSAQRQQVIALTLPQETFRSVRLPEGAQVYVYVGDIEDEWRRRPMLLQVVVPESPVGWGDSGQLKEPELARKLREVRAAKWSVKMSCLGDALEFDVRGRRYVLRVAKVTPRSGQKDTVDLVLSR